jgi:glycosyltransferase involved in cell wall biosynthesis
MIDGPLITFLLPFYNEQGFIGRTVGSLADQTDRRFRLILIDNGSTDRGRDEALTAAAAMPDMDTRVIEEPKPGKIFALQTGLAEVSTPFVGTMDADTIYPPGYVATCLDMFERNPDAACVMAATLTGDADSRANRLRRLRTRIYAFLFRSRAHSGGCAQAFATSALRTACGFDPALWPYVLEDHEVIFRVAKQGLILHPFGHYCSTAKRRSDRRNVSWNRAERIAYKLMPQHFMGWYFYRFLARRFEGRGKHSAALRSRSWDSARPTGGDT